MTATNDRGLTEDAPEMDVALAFGKIDADGDGSITREELWSYFGGKCDDLKKEDFDKLFNAIDKDKSGGIDLDEFLAFAWGVRRMYAERKTLRSSMKVLTLQESLQKQKRRTSKGAAPLRLLGRRSTMSLMHRQRAKRGKSLFGPVSGEEEEPEEVPASGSVRFFDVEVREYGMTASDNPGVRAGVALEMSWDFNILEREHLDTFEGRRSLQRSKNFTKEKKITRRERERILREYGATTEEMQQAAKRAALIRNARRRSVATQEHDQLKEDFENVTRIMRKILTFGRRKRKSNPLKGEALDVDRLHPTLMAMVGLEGGIGESAQ